MLTGKAKSATLPLPIDEQNELKGDELAKVDAAAESSEKANDAGAPNSDSLFHGAVFDYVVHWSAAMFIVI